LKKNSFFFTFFSIPYCKIFFVLQHFRLSNSQILFFQSSNDRLKKNLLKSMNHTIWDTSKRKRWVINTRMWVDTDCQSCVYWELRLSIFYIIYLLKGINYRYLYVYLLNMYYNYNDIYPYIIFLFIYYCFYKSYILYQYN